MAELIERAQRRLKRYWIHRQNNRQVEALAQWVADQSPAAVGRPVVFFNASTRLSGMSLNAAYALISSWAVRLSGHKVVHFVCDRGLSRCVLGTNRADSHQLPPCRECTRQSDVFYSAAPVWRMRYTPNPAVDEVLNGLGLTEMASIELDGIPLGELVLPSVRWVLRRYHLLDDEPTRFLFRQFLASAWGVVQEFNRLCEVENPHALVIFNGISYPEAAARWAAQQHGMRVVTHEVCHQPLSAFFYEGDATAYPIHVPEAFELSEEQNKRLDSYLEQRFQGKFSMAGIRFWPEMRSLSPEFQTLAAGFRQVVPVFTNVIFDTSQSHSNVIFEHMFDWLEHILPVMRNHPDTLFVIRAHPDETRAGKESQESVAEWVKQSSAGDLPNIYFVPSQEYFSSYELIQRAKFVMLYNSTIGLEAVLLGAAVLAAGRARFTQLPMVFFPGSKQEYHTLLEQFLAADPIQIPAEFQRNARRFLYINLFRACLRFDSFIEPDEVWAGYVRLKGFDPTLLKPEHTPVLRVIVNGILSREPFLMPKEEG